ncbi:phage/plasmid replication protein, II/X family, partial [Acinetobacter baumannii]
FHEGRTYPYVELKASPAKILQGHNVYGTDWIEQGALEMLGYLAESHPTLYGMLAIGETEVKQLDSTYSARLRDDNQVADAIDFLRNV